MQPGNNGATITLLHRVILFRANGRQTVHVPGMRNIDSQRAIYLPFFFFLEERLPVTIKTHLGQFLNCLVLTKHLCFGILLWQKQGQYA